MSHQTKSSDDCRECVSIVIPTYNSEKHIKDCIDSILNQGSLTTHIIVVDNHSSDRTRAIVRELFPHAQLLANASNLGYAGGCNSGFGICHSAFVGFVNADCTVDPNCIAELHNLMVACPRFGAVMPKICMKGDPALINTDGNQLQYLGFAACGNLNMPARGSVGIVTIPYPSGALMLVRRQAFEEVGGFDPDFFMYHEDVDFGLRLRLAGYDIACDRTALAYHDYEPWRNEKKLFYYERNRLATIFKIYSPRTLAVFGFALAAAEIGILGRAIRAGWMTTKCQTYLDLLRTLPNLLAKRSAIQSNRKVADPEILAHLTPSFESPLISNLRGLKILEAFLRGIHPLLGSQSHAHQSNPPAAQEGIRGEDHEHFSSGGGREI